MATKKPKPNAICRGCGQVYYDIAHSNRTCGHILPSGKPCKHVVSSAIQITDWEECPWCSGTGEAHERQHRRDSVPGMPLRVDPTCVPCSGSGWIFVRDDRLRRTEIQQEREKRAGKGAQLNGS
jgi:DnaJ-class molecular chaperone